jgi:hypothetical protein
VLICLIAAFFIFGCQPLRTVTASATPTIEVQISTLPYLTETPVPECVVLSDVELSAEISVDHESAQQG